MDYKPSWEFQKNFHADVLKGNEPDTLILVEHEPVFTLGKNASQDNLLDKNNSDVKVFNVTALLSMEELKSTTALPL